MKNLSKLGSVFAILLLAASCKNDNSPNYQYMPNMYEPVGYETYGEVDFLPQGMEAMQPAENTIPRGYVPYTFTNDPEGKELARLEASPLDSLNTENHLAEGGQLYTIYCALCHGDKGDGQGILVTREKILGVPNYSDTARNITAGSTYHTIYYGLNAMGSYAGQMDHDERWKVSEYVMKLKQDLTK